MEAKELDTVQGQHPSFSRSVIVTGAAAAMSMAFLFGETVVAARLLDPDSYGIYVSLIVVVNFLVMITDFGYKTAVTQLVAGGDRARQTAVVNSALMFRLAVLVLTAVLVWFGRQLLVLADPSRLLLDYITFLPLMIVFASLDELLLAMLQGVRAFRRMALAQITRGLVRLGLSVLMLTVLQMGVTALFWSWIISFALSALYQYFALPIPKALSWDRQLLREMSRFGLPLQLDRLLWFVSERIDVLLLVSLVGPTGVAYYNVAARIPMALMGLLGSYTAVYFPTVTALLAAGKQARAERMLNRSLRLISFAVGFVCLAAVVFSRQIMTFLFSNKYASSGPVFAVLMIAFHMMVQVNLMGYTLTSAGYPGRSLSINIVRSAQTLLASLLLIPVSGFIGPAYAKLAAYYTAGPVSLGLIRRSGIGVAVAPYVKQVAVLLFCAALFWWIRPAALVYSGGVLILYPLLSMALSTVSKADLELLLPATVMKRISAWHEVG